MFVLITIAMESFSMFGENLQKEISVRMYSGHEEVAESLHPPPPVMLFKLYYNACSPTFRRFLYRGMILFISR